MIASKVRTEMRPLDASMSPSASTLIRGEPGAELFTWSLWIALFSIVLCYIVRFGPDVPLWDDYAVIPQLCGAEPVTLGWLWSQHSEHRIPLARLILLLSFRLSGADPRVVMVFSGLLLGLLAAALIRAARRFRGGAAYADGFLPIVLLNPGQHANLLWSIQITYILPVFLLGIVLALVLRTARPTLASMTAVSVCLAFMPLCNAGGLALVPALTLWIALQATRVILAKGPRWPARALGMASLSLPSLILIVLYFYDYSSPRHHAAPAGPGAAMRTTVQFLAMGLGEPGAVLWPWSGLLVLLLWGGVFLVLTRSWWRYPQERARIEGLACVLGAVASLAIGTGWGRSGEDVLAGLQPRYTTLAVPALLGGYFAFACYGMEFTRKLIPMVLLAGGCLFLWPNMQKAWTAGQTTLAQAQAFDRDLAAGVPLFRLVHRHTPFLHPSQESLHEALTLLHKAEVGKFRSLHMDPPFQEQPIKLSPAEVRLARWSDGEVEVTGPDPWVRFVLSTPTAGCGIRIGYDHENADGSPAHFRIGWRGSNQRAFSPDQEYSNWSLPTGRGHTTTIWVDDLLSQIRIQPDNRPCRFKINELTVLVSPGTDLKRP